MTERGRAVPEEYLDGFAAMLADAGTTGRRLNRDELASRRDLGERAAEAGLGMRALVGAHLACARAHVGGGVTLDSVLGALEQAVDAFAEGYERAQRLAVRQEEAARREFIDDLLYGRSDLGLLAQRAERFGLRLSYAHAVAVAQGEVAYDAGDAVPRDVERALISRFGDRSILLTARGARGARGRARAEDLPRRLARSRRPRHLRPDPGRRRPVRRTRCPHRRRPRPPATSSRS